jgi:hypothetical protein
MRPRSRLALSTAALAVLVVGIYAAVSGQETAKSPEQDRASKFAAVKGVVTYNGTVAPEVRMIVPTRDADKCPPFVPGQGWYVDGKTKGIRYVVVFLKAGEGKKLPDPPPQLADVPKGADGQPQKTQRLTLPRCQFEPRVVCLHPKQEIRIENNGPFPIDANISSARNNVQQTLYIGQAFSSRLRGDDAEPNKVGCGQHPIMSGYVWKFTHPYAAVTDSEGRFEIKDIAISKEIPLSMWVWHEMLPANQRRETGTLQLRPGETLEKNIALPIPDS